MGKGGCQATRYVRLGERCSQKGCCKELRTASVTEEELAKHNTASDCWLSIEGQVYDVTDWLKVHPGGSQTIAVMGGQDATDVFNAFHERKVWARLPAFHVGKLIAKAPPQLVLDHRTLAKQLEADEVFKTRPSFYFATLAGALSFLLLALAGVLLFKNVVVHMVSALLLGLFWNQCAYIGHDTGHNGITKSRKHDSLIGLVVGNACTGIGITWWKTTHNVHHIVCNSLDYDPDVQHVPLFAVSSTLFKSLYSFYHNRRMTFDRVARFFISYQHLTFYPVMAVARLNLYAQTWILLLTGKRSWKKAAEAGALLLYFTWLGLLLSALPGWAERIAFFLISHAVTGILHVQICLSHFPMPTFEGRPESNGWVATQMKGTLDIDCPPWMDWFHGGLQFQYEHHLFPRLPRHSLRTVASRVQALAKKHNLPCIRVSFWEANRMLLGTLHKAAMEARDLTKPAPALQDTLFWEALNAGG